MSPNVTITESVPYYQTHVSPEVSAFVGHFERGPVDSPVWITGVNQFKITFGRGIGEHQQDWYQVYNYLQYSSGIWVVRSAGSTSSNASSHNLTFKINDYQSWVDLADADLVQGNSFTYIAKTMGSWGNSVTVSTVVKSDWDDNVELFNGTFVREVFTFFEDGFVGVLVFKSDELVEQHYKTFDDLYSVNDGSYVYLSINDSSDINDFKNTEITLTGGSSVFPLGEEVTNSYDLLLNETDYQLDAIIGNEAFNNEAVRIAETRKDCIAYLGLPSQFVEFLQIDINGEPNYLYTSFGDIMVSEISNHHKLNSETLTKIENYVKLVNNSEFTHLTLNVKIQKDLFTGRNIPINLAGDIAGLKAESSLLNPWIPSCGLTRGTIKNVVRMKFQMSQPQIDYFYKLGCNYTLKNVVMSQRSFVSGINSSSIHLRNIKNHIEKIISRTLNDFVFETNDFNMRYNASYRVKKLLEEIMLHRGISSARVNARKQSNFVIVVDVELFLVEVIEKINLRFTRS